MAMSVNSFTFITLASKASVIMREHSCRNGGRDERSASYHDERSQPHTARYQKVDWRAEV